MVRTDRKARVLVLHLGPVCPCSSSRCPACLASKLKQSNHQRKQAAAPSGYLPIWNSIWIAAHTGGPAKGNVAKGWHEYGGIRTVL